MKFKLRDYQQAAVDAAMEHMRKSTEPCVLELATGAGKSLCVSEIARILHDLSKKRILCLQPSAELTQQNYEKFIANGGQASIYSASISKSLRHYVVYATPLTFINAPVSVKKQFSAVIVDECFHGDTLILTSSGYKKISDDDIKNSRIACLNEQTGEILFKKPLKVWSNGTKNVSQLNHSEGSVICTNTHKFYTQDSWVKAENLHHGQMLTLEDLNANVFIKLRRAVAAVVKKLFLKLQSQKKT